MRLLIALAATAVAAPAAAQDPASDPHAHHHMAPPEAAPSPASPQATPADPHAGHHMPMAPEPAAAPDPHAHHHMASPAAPTADAPPPPIPTDHAADAVFPAAEMAAARETLRHEHGDISWSRVMIETAEYRPSESGDSYRWRARASFGGDIDRFLVKTEGEGQTGDVEKAEVQALYSRAIGPNFNLLAGVRQDFEPKPRRTYATLGVEGVAPYWFDVEAALFLSDKGDVLARLEGSYDLRLTQRLVLEPRAEANLAAQDVAATGVGSGLSDLELGLRLRYAIQPEFAPYVGVNWERSFGHTADFARAAGRGVEQTRFVVGVRAWF